MGDVDPLAPSQLRRVLSALVVGEALVLDCIRGRSVRQDDVADLRQAVRGVHRVLDALDDERPWEPEPEET